MIRTTSLPRRLARLCLTAVLAAAGPALAGGRTVGADPAPAVSPQRLAPPASPQTERSAPPAAARALTKEDLDTFLDGFMGASLERQGVAGASVSVVADGRLLTARGFGYADMGRRIPVTEDTLFRVGSISKLFTWTAVMQLVEQGRIDLDRDIDGYLDFRIRSRDGRPVTMRQLMTHTAGFEEALRDLIVIGGDGRLQSLADFSRTHQPVRIFPAGEVPAYSNYGAALAGYIVQRVSGLSYADYVEQRIFKPLGMAHSSARLPTPVGLQASLGYRTADGPPIGIEYLTATPAGVISSSASDMTRFMIAHLNGGALPGDEASRILRPQTVAQMHDTLRAPAPGVQPMALGFYRDDKNGVPLLAHAGDTIVFHSDLHIAPGRGVGLFVSVNSAGIGGGGHVVRAELLRRFMDRYYPAPPPPPADPNARYSVTRRLDGMYMSSRRPQTTIFGIFGLLQQAKIATDARGVMTAGFLKGVTGAPVGYREVRPDLWQVVGGTDRLGVVRDAQGRVSQVAADANGPTDVYQPVPWTRSAAWLTPGLGFAVAWMIAGFLSWPMGAIYRRHYGVAATPARSVERLGRWAARLGTLTSLGFLFGVFSIVGALGAYQFWPVQSGAVPFLRFVQLLAATTLLAAVGVAVGAASTWAHPKGRIALAVGRTGLALSLALVGYVALAFNVLAPSMVF